MVAAHDVGKVLNPVHLEGQMYGSLHMGIGYALTFFGLEMWRELNRRDMPARLVPWRRRVRPAAAADGDETDAANIVEPAQ